MPCRYEIFSDINLVRITCTGRLTRDDLITLLDELDNHPDFHPNIDDIIEEVASARVTERGARADDKRSEAAMEERKRQGYF